jgi:hypothetical protein
MAIVKAVSSKASIGKAIQYVTKPEKTEEKLVSGIECSPYTAIQEMMATKEMWGKTEGRQYKHFVQSFKPDENITPEKAHELAKELCKDRFKGHEVLIATHTDRDSIHSHIIVNSVNYETGYKYQSHKNDLAQMKEHSDELCRQNGLSITVKGENSLRAYDMKKYKVIEKDLIGQGKSYVYQCYTAVDEVRDKAVDREDFIAKMKEKGYETTWSDKRKHVTFKDQEGNKVRNSNLEKTFDKSFGKEDLERGFERNDERERVNHQARRQLDRAVGADTGIELGDIKATIGKAGNANDAERARREAQRTDEICRREQEERARQQKTFKRNTKSSTIER